MNQNEPAKAIPRRNRLVALDGLRALAALEILLFHADRYLWSPPEEAVFWFRLRTIAAFPIQFGYETVMLFFVLSGFVIHRQYTHNQHAGQTNFNQCKFLLQRARRIYPTLLLALVFTFIVDRIGGSIAPEYYFPPGAETRSFRHDPLTILGNLLFSQHLVVNTFGSNMALWALGYLGWYYVLYAIVYVPLRQRAGKDWAFGMILAASLVGVIVFTVRTLSGECLQPVTAPWLWHILGHVGIWFLGAWLADCVSAGFRLRRPGIWLIGALLLIVGLMGTHEMSREFRIVIDWLWGCAFGVIILVLATASERQSSKSLTTTKGSGFSGILSLRESLCLTLHQGYRPAEPTAPSIPPPPEVGASWKWSELPFVTRVDSILTFFAPLAASSYVQYVIQVPPLVFARILMFQQCGHISSQPWLALSMSVGIMLLAYVLTPLIEAPFTRSARRRQSPKSSGSE